MEKKVYRLMLFAISLVAGFTVSFIVGRIYNTIVKTEQERSSLYNNYMQVDIQMPSEQVLRIMGYPSCVDSTGFVGGAKECMPYTILDSKKAGWIYLQEKCLVKIIIQNGHVDNKLIFYPPRTMIVDKEETRSAFGS